MDKAVGYLKEHRAEHLGWTIDLCKIPSISTKAEHKPDVAAAVRWTHELCQRVGLDSRVCETGGHPAVYAEWCKAPGKPTYLVYGHVDVQPTGDLELWEADPFEPVQKDGWLVCRGSADDKGQVLIYIRAAAAWLATEGKLPVNLKFLIEGEEEISSPNLGPFVEKNRDLLACDHILISDTGLIADEWPTITYATRGMLYKEVRLSGPNQDLHSGTHGGAVANPANELARLIASLHDERGRVTIPGFYDDVVELSADERAALNALPIDEQQYVASLGSPAPAGEAGYTTMERRSIRPTLDVNGIYGGFMAEGANTIVPARAGAKVSMRLVAKQDAEKLSGVFDKCIRARCPQTVRLEILNHGACDAYMAPRDSREMKAATRALKEAFGKETALIPEGGSLPILPMFRSTLGADCLMIGLASPSCNAHGPNEKVLIGDLDRGTEAVARLFAYLAE